MNLFIKRVVMGLSSLCFACFSAGALPLTDIAATASPECALGGAFDGERYLIGLQLDGESNAVQFVSTAGVHEGAPIPIPGAFGMPPDVAYGSNVFLVAWAGFDGAVHGQVVTPAGVLQGGSFLISSTNEAVADFGTCRTAFGGGRFLVAWEDTRLSSEGDTDVFGQLVSASGTLVSANVPLSGTVDGDDSNLSIGFDGNNFLAVYSSEAREGMYDGEDVYGRFVSPLSGPLGSPFVIDENDIPSCNPTATVFDGERYVVLFHESISLTNAESWQIYARFVSTNGVVAGDRILLAGSETVAAQFPSLGWNGSNFLVALREGAPDHWEEGAPGSELDFIDANAVIRARWYDADLQPTSNWLTVTDPFGDNEAVLGTLMLPSGTGFALGIQTFTTNWVPVHVYGAVVEVSLQGVVGDNFNDNSKDSAKWGDDLYFGTNTAAALNETNGRLEFTKPAGLLSEGVLRPWIQTMGSYTQDWEAAVDVYLGNIALPEENDAWININLAVSRLGDTNMTHAVPLGLDLYRDGAMVYRGYELTPMYDGTEVTNAPNYGYLTTTNLSGRLRLSFDASTKIISAACNGQLIGQVDVDEAGSDWGMTDGSAFVFSVVGSTGIEALGVSSGQVFADNFELLGTVSAAGPSQFSSVTLWRSLEADGPALFEVDVSAPEGKTITVTVPTVPAIVYDVVEAEFEPGEYEYYDPGMTTSPMSELETKYPQGDYVLRMYSDAGKTNLEETLVVSFGTGEALPFPEVDPSLTQPVPVGDQLLAEPEQTYTWPAYSGTAGTATHMTLEITGTGEEDEYFGSYDADISGSASYTPPTIPPGAYDLELAFFFRQNTQTPGGTFVACANERYARYALTVEVPDTLADALGCPDLTFNTGGDTSWFIQSAVVLDGVYGAQSGAISDRQTSWMETSVEGPGTLSFHWKVSCEDDVLLDDWDYVAVTVNGVEVARRDGITEWELVQVPLEAGMNIVRWTYTKDRVVSEGMDCAWVDGVSWTPTPQETQTTPVPVPHLWLDLYTSVFNGDYEMAAFSDEDGDGHLAWEEYVAGTYPDDPESVLRAHIHFENGQPVVTWNPDHGLDRIYHVEGRASLSEGDWEPATEGQRFFRVRVEMPALLR